MLLRFVKMSNKNVTESVQKFFLKPQKIDDAISVDPNSCHTSHIHKMNTHLDKKKKKQHEIYL